MLGLRANTQSFYKKNTPYGLGNLSLWYDFAKDFTSGTDADSLDGEAVTNRGTAGSDYNGTIANALFDNTHGFANKRHCIEFDGSDDEIVLANAFTATDQNWTMFCAFHLDGTVGQDCLFAGSSGGVNRINVYNANNVHIRANGSGSSNGAKLIATNSTANSSTDYNWNTNPDILVIRQDSDKSLYAYSGSASASSAWFVGKSVAYADASNTNIKIKNIGAFQGATTEFQGWIGEIGLFNEDIGENKVLYELIPYLRYTWGF